MPSMPPSAKRSLPKRPGGSVDCVAAMMITNPAISRQLALPEIPTPAQPIIDPADIEKLAVFIQQNRRLVVLTGAGCSTESGIPDYRDNGGDWKQKQPIQYQEFVRSHQMRQRYWARSMIGWTHIARAEPNTAHWALAELEAGGCLHQLITQNVDGLHQKAGSRKIIDLHGRLDAVECLSCRNRFPRNVMQGDLEALNPGWRELTSRIAPDGDMDLYGVDYGIFQIPDCRRCTGILKPDVVFFGEAVPGDRVETAFARLAEADALLVAGSSLMVWSGYRFVKAAVQQGLPVAAINLGRTRADAEFTFKVKGRCGDILPLVVERLRKDLSR